MQPCRIFFYIFLYDPQQPCSSRKRDKGRGESRHVGWSAIEGRGEEIQYSRPGLCERERERERETEEGRAAAQVRAVGQSSYPTYLLWVYP